MTYGVLCVHALIHSSIQRRLRGSTRRVGAWVYSYSPKWLSSVYGLLRGLWWVLRAVHECHECVDKFVEVTMAHSFRVI